MWLKYDGKGSFLLISELETSPIWLASARHRRGPALGGPGFYRFYVTRVSGPCMRPYNVPNDRVLTLSAGSVGNKQYVAGSHRSWPLALLQSAQSAARALAVVRGSCSSRLCPRLLRRIRCCSRLQIPSITARHRCCIVPNMLTTRKGLESKSERRRASAFVRVHKP